jgi:hypothetical protein
VDYARLDYEALVLFGIKIEKSLGGTPDTIANVSWHRDLTELSVRQVADPVRTIVTAAQRSRVPEKTIAQWIRQAVMNGQVQREQIGPRVIAKLGPVG